MNKVQQEKVLQKIRLAREQLDRAEAEVKNEFNRRPSDAQAEAASWIDEAESYCSEAYAICHR